MLQHRNEDVRRRAGIERGLVSRTDQRVLRCGKNVGVVYGQKGVDDESKWMVSTRETELRLDGWCEGGHGYQRNDGAGPSSIRGRSERVESPGTYVTELVSHGHFCLALCSFGPPSRTLVVITWRGVGCRYMMLLG